MGYTLKELRELTDEQLIAEHDNVAQSTASGLTIISMNLNAGSKTNRPKPCSHIPAECYG